MDVQTCILTRRSVRQFTQEPVPRELLEDVVAQAAYAPRRRPTPRRGSAAAPPHSAASAP